MTYDKGRDRGRAPDRGSGSSGGGGGSRPKSSIVLIPVEISEKEVKVRIKLYNSDRDRLLQFSMGGVVSTDAIRETAGMEVEYVFSILPNTLECMLKAETLDGEPALSREIRVKTDKPVKEPVINKATKLKIVGTDNGGLFFKALISRTDDKGFGVEGEVIIHDGILRKGKSDKKGIIEIIFPFGNTPRMTTTILPEKPDQFLEIEIPAKKQFQTETHQPKTPAPATTEPQKPLSARLKEAYKKGRTENDEKPLSVRIKEAYRKGQNPKKEKKDGCDINIL
jgi:hypothetical protein